MKVPFLPLLVLAAVAQPLLGQFVPPPEAPSWNSWKMVGSNSFPLPDHASARLAREFDSTAESPDWKIARLMAELSFLAYEDSIPSVQNRLRLYNLSLGEFVTVDNHHFITAWDQTNDVLVIAFRGTDIAQLADVWTDLDYEKHPLPEGNVHKGFYEASQALMRSVVAAIEHREHPQHIWLTGHSLGGAIATLTMPQLEMQGHRVGGLVTFGQPRVGDLDFTSAMNRRLGARMLRIINEDDVVASLPPRIPLVMPAYFSGGSVVQFLDGRVVRSPGVVVQAPTPSNDLDDLFGSPSNPANPSDDLFSVSSSDDAGPAFTPAYNIDRDAPRTPDGLLPPDPEPLTAEQFEELKDILSERDGVDVDAVTYGSPLGGPFDRLDLKRRAGNHPMHLYIQQIERFAAREGN